MTVDWRSDGAVQQAVDRLHEHGVAYVPAFLPATEALEADFDKALAEEGAASLIANTAGGHVAKNLSRHVGETNTGIHVKLGSYERYSDRLPELSRVFGLPFMEQVAEGYLRRPFSLNRHVVLTYDWRPAEQILPFHFDEMNSLKFFIYVTATHDAQAPFELIPGTHVRCREIRRTEWQRTDDYRQIRNHLFDQFSEEFFYNQFDSFKQMLLLRTLAFDGPAGTLVIFDTDCLHRGGRLDEGNERKVMRASSYRGFWPDSGA
jgi:hypothetical protein